MRFFKRPQLIRRYSQPSNIGGYMVIPYRDITLLMDVQTLENTARTKSDGTDSVQRLKVFCDYEILTENERGQQKADRLWFQNKWFDCQSSRLSENTPLRHWTATFIECLDQDPPPGDDETGEYNNTEEDADDA